MRGLTYALILAAVLANELAFTYNDHVNYIQPTSTSENVKYIVSIQDEAGNPKATEGVQITLSTTPHNVLLGNTVCSSNSTGQCEFDGISFLYVGNYTLVASATDYLEAYLYVNITDGTIPVKTISVTTHSGVISANFPFDVNVTILDSNSNQLIYDCSVTLKDSLEEVIMSDSSLTETGKGTANFTIWYGTPGKKTIEAECEGIIGKLDITVYENLLDIELNSIVSFI